MKRILMVALVLCCVPAQAQRYSMPAVLSDQDVEAAIVRGRANQLKGLVQRCTTEPSKVGAFAAFGLVGLAVQAARDKHNATYEVQVMSAPGRIATAAWDATRAGSSFSRSQVDDAWRQPALYVIVAPILPPQDKNAEAIFPSPVKAVLVAAHSQTTSATVTFKSLGDMVTVPRTWRNSSGAMVEYADTITPFDIHPLPSLSDEEVEFAIDADAGRRNCAIGASKLKTFVIEK